MRSFCCFLYQSSSPIGLATQQTAVLFQLDFSFCCKWLYFLFHRVHQQTNWKWSRGGDIGYVSSGKGMPAFFFSLCLVVFFIFYFFVARNKPGMFFFSSHRPRCRSWMWRMNKELTVWPPGYSLTFCFPDLPANYCWVSLSVLYDVHLFRVYFPTSQSSSVLWDEVFPSSHSFRWCSPQFRPKKKTKDMSLKLKPVKYLYIVKVLYFGSHIRLCKKKRKRKHDIYIRVFVQHLMKISLSLAVFSKYFSINTLSLVISYLMDICCL